MTAASTARALRCQNCGSHFSLQYLHPQVQCPYCHHVQAVPPQLLAELGQYQQHVAGHVQQAQQHDARIESWRRWNVDTPVKTQAAAMIGASLILGLIMMAGVGAIQMGKKDVGASILHLTVMGSFALPVAYVIWYAAKLARRKRSAHAPLQGATVACPNCGAPGTITPGDAVDTCRFCHAALMPSRTAIAHGIQQAESLARQAEMALYRQERTGTANLHSFSPYLMLYVYASVGGSLLPMIGWLTVYTTREYMRGNPEVTQSILIISWAFTLIVFFVIALLVYLHVARKLAFRRVMLGVVRQFGGQLENKLDKLVEWLNRYWAGPYDLLTLPPGKAFAVTTQQVRGFPTAIHLNPYEPLSSNQSYAPSPKAVVQVLVAAWEVGGPTTGHPHAAGQLRTQLEQMGYSVSEERAGLMATASPSLRKQIRRKPASLDQVSNVLDTLTRLAEARGRMPATAIP